MHSFARPPTSVLFKGVFGVAVLYSVAQGVSSKHADLNSRASGRVATLVNCIVVI